MMILSPGGKGIESGGPGIMYFEETSTSFTNLRVDNGCQSPKVFLM